jgi:hypothetical protein
MENRTTKRWTPDQIALAAKLREEGLTSKEIGRRLGVSASAIRSALSPAHQTRCRAKQPYYMSPFFNGPPIARCRTQERLVEDAVAGSERLKVAILQAIVRASA